MKQKVARIEWLFICLDAGLGRHAFLVKLAGGVASAKRWFDKKFPGYTLLSAEPDRIGPIVDAVRAEAGIAWKALCSKCRWESCTPLVAVMNYGDPREWKSVKLETNASLSL